MTKILVIDDEIEKLVFVLQMLEYEGFDILKANNGADAVALAQVNAPEIVLCDVMMTQMDGVAVVQALRSHPATQHIPVILMSGMGETELARKTMTLSGVSYLVKPFVIGDLLTLIRLSIA
jgi:CheY-like chemotaxis protein